MTTAPFLEPHLSGRDRRSSRSRRSLELILDGIFRPGDWAAMASYLLGLQGHLRTTTTVVESGPIRRERPLRIAFASDFHAGPTTAQPLLRRACEALAAIGPDVLLLGGDFVSVRASYIHR